ncbi:MAG: hypothetical protein V3U54_06785 [Thermodesulfobacteriota bacterium]
MKKLIAFIISSIVILDFSTSSPAKTNLELEKEIQKITKETPLVLQHANSVFDEVNISQHQSHMSHWSHRSHYSHVSHRSGY